MERKRTHFLSKKDLLAEVIACKSTGKMSDKLARMLMLMAERLSKKGNFASYTYIEDMRSFAIASLVKTWKDFDVSKSENPFAFYTQCIINSFKQFLNQEKKQRNIRDLLLINSGMDPSYSFQIDNDRSSMEWHQDIYAADKEPRNIIVDDEEI